MTDRPDIIVIITDQERAAPPYEGEAVARWRRETLTGRQWFDDHGVSFDRHYTGSLACVPSRPTLLTGQYPDVHGVTQTDGLGKQADDSRMRWLREGEVPTLGHWFRAGGYDTFYDGKWHVSHAELIDETTGAPLASNDDDGVVDPDAVARYLDADLLDPFGFHGWVGPEPHGAAPANAGLARDPLIADRVVDWLEDRYARRAAGDPEAQRPFLCVASFVNPHDIVFLPAWAATSTPLGSSPADPPPVPPPPTAEEDLATKPAAQAAYRSAYHAAYGPADAVEQLYEASAQLERDIYHRLHAEVDGPLDRVRRAVTDHASDAVVVRTSDHGELLGAHGGIHQKWFMLYDEATRVPFTVVRVGDRATSGRRIGDAPTSHVDLVPTLLGAAGIDVDAATEVLRASFSELHPLPGRDLMPVVEGDEQDRERPVYLMTRDNIVEGDSGATVLARQMGVADDPPPHLRSRIAAHVGSGFEGLVVRVPEADAAGGHDHLWKVVRTFDDPATWTEPGVRQADDEGPDGVVHRTEPLPDEWELYDLDADPIEADNRWRDAPEVLAHLQALLTAERARQVAERNQAWPYVSWGRVGDPVG